MKPKTWYAISAKASDKQTEISIFDEIGFWGVSAKQFISDLQKVPADHEINLRIHSPGGEVFDGNAIANALKRHPGGYSVQIEGLAASMATVISLGGQPVKMAENGFYMIHNPWGMAVGDATEMRDQAELLEKIQTGIVNAYAAKSGKSVEQIQEWMDAETWFTASEAKDAGFVDEITDTVSIAASANVIGRLSRYRNAPENLTSKINLMTEEPAAVDPKETSAPEPEAVETPAVEETPEPVVEAPDVEETPAPETPVAVLPGADSINAKFNAVLAERDAFKAKAEKAEAELKAERTALANLERSLGVAAAAIVPEVKADNADAGLTITREQFSQMNIAEQNKFFRDGGKLS
jgi:ATP-dependent Clp endopeptidase proteolytic subunit ClpP